LEEWPAERFRQHRDTPTWAAAVFGDDVSPDAAVIVAAVIAAAAGAHHASLHEAAGRWLPRTPPG
jgi:hypothetical protein